MHRADARRSCTRHHQVPMHQRIQLLFSVVMAVTACAWLGPGVVWGQAAADTPRTIVAFDQPLLFTYGTWGRAEVRAGMLHLDAAGLTNQGGGGANLSLDLAAERRMSPALRLRVGDANEAGGLRLMLTDAAGNKATWKYKLAEATREATLLVPVDAAGLDAPQSTDEKNTDEPDLGALVQWQLVGDWSGNKPLSVVVESIELVAPTPEMQRQREARAVREAEAGREAARELAEAFAGIAHTPESPEVIAILPADVDLLEVSVQEGELVLSRPEPYDPQPGDRVKEEGGTSLVWDDGELVEGRETRTVMRTLDGRERPIGRLVGGRAGKPMLLPDERKLGQPLQILTVDLAQSYEIRSADDPAYARWTAPTEVFRKSKPSDRVMPGNEQLVRHRIYLKLPHPLQDGATYQVRFVGLNTRQETVAYTHDPATTRSPAVHASHVGYRPGDPYKRGFLSLWLGTGGPHTFDRVDTFYLLDADGSRVYEGPVEKVLAVDGEEQVRPPMNLSRTAVYALDFSGYTTPGTVRLFVPGLGVSDPVTIADGVWEDAFRLAMHGFLTQRSGLALGPPLTEFTRPRDLYPGDDGFVVFQSTASLEDAYDPEAKGNWFRALAAGRTERTLPGAWGGYHDAGDYDRAVNHLWATYLHLELLDLFPDYFGALKLNLPADEAGDALPDLLNEALWNLDLFLRLQQDDGGVGGGVEASAHPRSGEPSQLDSLAWFAYAPDAGSSYTYAAVAARAARLLERHDADRATTYRGSALKAWGWAERHREGATGYGYQAIQPEDARNAAAVELLALTGEARFDDAFAETTQLGTGATLIEQQGAAFAYARLPEGVGRPSLKGLARQTLVEQADRALQYGDGNVFGLTIEIPDMPLIGPVGAFTVPGMLSQVLPRAHYLTGEPRYLAGLLRTANASAGANPDDRAMTTGLGPNPPHAPLHLDSRYNGQRPPAGLTVYGPYEHASNPGFTQASEWVHTWMLADTMTPPSRTWPSPESYVDLFMWPMMNEFTIKQTMGPTSYTWGYLAARP